MREVAITFSFGFSEENSNISSTTSITYIIKFNLNNQRKLMPVRGLLPQMGAIPNLQKNLIKNPNLIPKKMKKY